MKEVKNSLYPPDWLEHVRRDWRCIYSMLEDIEEAKKFVKTMFPEEELNA